MLQALDEKSIVFGLDIGTRSVVGTVGYRDEETFHVLAQSVRAHKTRSMIDGQIHDINEVGKTILDVKTELEEMLGIRLYEVCIAAAGRVLKTIPVHMEHNFEENTVVTLEHLHTMDLLGVELAQDILNEENDTNFNFYSVGYSTVQYFANDDPMSSILGHKVKKMAEDMIVTFLPDDVVDGLYSAVSLAGLEVANLTLEPIAAINVAIPKSYRSLNLALVDVGAGTSDISITKDGSIIAYGMIPLAGDELTEVLVQKYLVDFNTAEAMKIASGSEKSVDFKDILAITHNVSSDEILESMAPVLERMTKEVAEKIIELNGDKSVSACFVVGGGGKVLGYTELLAKELSLAPERVALRGEEVLSSVEFENDHMQRDSLMVTPVGICLSSYEKKNSFITVTFNEKQMRLYDNSKLTVMDAAVQAGFPNEDLFAKQGAELRFLLDGKPQIVKGEAGEPAQITQNGEASSLNAPLVDGAEVTIVPSTEGVAARCNVGDLVDYIRNRITFVVNGRGMQVPMIAKVNGNVVSEFYSIAPEDSVELTGGYTVGHLFEYLDEDITLVTEIMVNDLPAVADTEIEQNDSVEWVLLKDKQDAAEAAARAEAEERAAREAAEAKVQAEMPAWMKNVPGAEKIFKENMSRTQTVSEATEEAVKKDITMDVTVNGSKVQLSGKEYYIFVDIFDAIHFDLNAGKGRSVVTRLNGKDAQYTQALHQGDVLEVFWQ